MAEKPDRARISVAIVGVGSNWEQHYRDAVLRLSSKIRVKAICDPVHVRAVACADEFRAVAVTSPWQLAQRRDLHAWLILDPGWLGTYPAMLAVQNSRPALVANALAFPLPRWVGVLRESAEHGESLMPELLTRFLPATTRLRELMATKLGAVQSIEIQVSRPADGSLSMTEWLEEHQAEVTGLFDCCRYLMGRSATTVGVESAATETRLNLAFASTNDSRTRCSRTANVSVIESPSSGSPTWHVECERGSATISGPETIAWQTTSDRAEESLPHERSPYEIVLDQFCRRALGGLVPVATPADALHAVAAFCGALESLQCGGPVVLGA